MANRHARAVFVLFAISVVVALPVAGGDSVVAASGELMPTTTTLSIEPTSVKVREEFTLRATITPAPPDGRVTFRTVGSSSVTLGDVPVAEGGEVTITAAFGRAWSWDVVARFYGSTSHDASTSSPVRVTVTRTATTLELSLSTDVIESGDTLEVTAVVTPVPDNSPYPEQAVSFSFGSHAGYGHWAAAYPDPATGIATLQLPATNLVPDLWTLTASYHGNALYDGSSDRATFRYEPVPPLVNIAADPNPAYPGDPVTLTVSIDPPPDGGTVELFALGPVGVDPLSLGTAPVQPDGRATLIASFEQNEGLHLRATYSGTGTASPSRSGIFQRKQMLAPNTWWTSKPDTWHRSSDVDFAFKSLPGYEPAVLFECRLDEGDWYGCTSPTSVSGLMDGPHVFEVRGTDANGRVEEYPERASFRVDTSAPTFTFTLNGGAAATDNPRVDIVIDGYDQWAVSDMRIYNSLVLASPGMLTFDGQRQYRSELEWGLTHEPAGGTPDDGMKTVYLQLADHFGHWSEIQSQSIMLDTTGPTSAPPTVGIRKGKMRKQIPVIVTWPDPADALSSVATGEWQRQVGSGLWGAVPSADTGTSTDELVKATWYHYRQRGYDELGNVGAWSSTASYLGQIRPENGAALRWRGTWESLNVKGALGGAVRRSNVAGAAVSTSFTGTGIAWVSTKGPRFGKAAIYVDGERVAKIDLYGTKQSTRHVVWSTAFASPGRHTVEVRVLGTKGRPAVDLDAFLTLASP